MKKYLILAMFFVLAAALISPVSVSAAAKAGVKSGSFFYFFDTASEKINLFFTFNSEKKAKKALEYAEERLAEAEESASENKPEAVAVAMENYQEDISLAETEAKSIKDETKTKDLLSTIASSTSKHQEILMEVLSKVPEEAKEAIEKAIEASKKGREEAMKEKEELEKEVSEIKQEPEEIKNEDEQSKSNNDKDDNKKEASKKDEQKKEIEKLKKDIETLKQKQSQFKIIEKIIEKPIIVEKKESSSSQIKQNENIITLPNGAVVETDANGNVVRYIQQPIKVKETPSTSSSNTNNIVGSIVAPLVALLVQTPQSVTLSCTQDVWNCSDWSGCSTSSYQTRTCNKTFDCSTVSTPSPNTTQGCTPLLTYEQLHCPRVYKITDSLGNIYEFPVNGMFVRVRKLFGSFAQGSVSQITFKVFIEDPQGLPIRYVWGGNASQGFSRPSTAPPFQASGQLNWISGSEFTIDVSDTISTGSGSFFSMQYDNSDSFYCYGTGSIFDGVVNFEYTVYPSTNQ